MLILKTYYTNRLQLSGMLLVNYTVTGFSGQKHAHTKCIHFDVV